MKTILFAILVLTYLNSSLQTSLDPPKKKIIYKDYCQFSEGIADSYSHFEKCFLNDPVIKKLKESFYKLFINN